MVFGGDVGGGWRESERRGDGGVELGDGCRVFGGGVGEGVGSGVLVGVVFGGGGETHGGEAGTVKRRVVAAAGEAIGTEDEVDLHGGNVAFADFLDVAGEGAGGGIDWVFAEEADGGVGGAAVAGEVVADDVVVEDGVDDLLVGGGALGIEVGPDEAILFAGEGDEDQRLFELVLA